MSFGGLFETLNKNRLNSTQGSVDIEGELSILIFHIICYAFGHVTENGIKLVILRICFWEGAGTLTLPQMKLHGCLLLSTEVCEYEMHLIINLIVSSFITFNSSAIL